jgi:hypothetical protein
MPVSCAGVSLRLRYEDRYTDHDDNRLYHTQGRESDEDRWITLETRIQTSAAVVTDNVQEPEGRKLNCFPLIIGDTQEILASEGRSGASTADTWGTGVDESVSTASTRTMMMTIGVANTSSVPTSTAVVSHRIHTGSVENNHHILTVTQVNSYYSGTAAPTASSSRVLVLVRGAVLSTVSLSTSSASGSTATSHGSGDSKLLAVLNSAPDSDLSSSSSRSSLGAAGTVGFQWAVRSSRKNGELGRILPGALVGGVVFLAVVIAGGVFMYRRRRRQQQAEAEAEAARRGFVRRSLPSQWWW